MNELTKVSELRIGDTIRIGDPDEPYNDYTVVNVEGRNVHLYGVYVTTADFIYTGGVIPYVGTREMSLDTDSSVLYPVLRRGDPEKYRRIVRGIVDDIRAALDNGQVWKARDLLRQL